MAGTRLCWSLVLVVAICLQGSESAPLGESVSLGDAMGESDPALAGLQDKVKNLEGSIETLKDEQPSIKKREASLSDGNWEKDAEDAAARRTAAEAAVEDLEARVQREKEDSANRVRELQLNINREIQNRKDKLKAHDEAMAAKEAAMEERIADLDKQSQRQDQLLKNQLGRIGDNRKKLSGMGDQMSKLTELANEGEEVADVLKNKYHSGLSVIEPKTREEEKRLQAEQLRVPHEKKAILTIQQQEDPLREKAKEERAKAVAAEEKQAEEEKKAAASKAAADDSATRLEHSPVTMRVTRRRQPLASRRRSS